MSRFIDCLCRLARLLACAAMLSGTGSAATIIVNSVTDGDFGIRNLWIRENGEDVQAYYVGVLQITLTEGSESVVRDSLCVDLFTNIGIGSTYNTTVLSPDQVSGKNTTRVSWLVDNVLLPTEAGTTFISALPEEDWVTTDAQGAGLQLAIWDIVHDGGDGLSQGSVQASVNTDAQVVEWTNTYLALSLNQSSDLAYVYQNVSTDNVTPAQTLIGPMYDDGGPQPTPEPATLVLTGAALVALGALRRRGLLG